MVFNKKKLAIFRTFFLPISYLLLIILYFFLYRVYASHASAFGCFDDCFNIGAGYFLMKGKILYSQLFFNHQLLMPYISALIQAVSHPVNLYDLVLRHRQFLLIFTFFLNALIVYRFRSPGLFFVFLYEITKVYLFGDRFLAEAFIAYPLAYLTGIVWYKFQGKTIFLIDYTLLAIFAWFVIFMREPYTIAIALILGFLLFGKKNKQWKIISVFCLIILTAGTLMFLPLKDFYYNVVTLNSQTIFKQEAASNQLFTYGLLRSFFYPVYIFFDGYWNPFRYFLVGLSSVFFVASVFHFRIYRKATPFILLFVILGFSNLRAVNPPGYIFYAAFNMLSWYAIFTLVTCLIVSEIWNKSKKIGGILGLILLMLLTIFIAFPDSYIKQKTNTQVEFINNYGNYLQVGEVVKALSTSKNTLFLDGFDEIIYWQADRISPYKYGWYTSFMPVIPKFASERLLMFKNASPDFYYGACPGEKSKDKLLPEDVRDKYQRFYNNDKPSCLYIKKLLIPSLSPAGLKKAKEFLYTLP